MPTVFLVQHERRVPPPPGVKLIGVFSTRRAAEAAVERLRERPGFRELPASFTVDEISVDRDHWKEGFGVPNPEAEGRDLPLPQAVCAMCNTPVKPVGDDPVEIFVRSAQDEGEQGLYAHAQCLRRCVHPSVPLVAGLADA
jgi:hypothetical protein